MKKLLMLMLPLLIAPAIQANDLTGIYTDSIGADSNSTRTDTFYTPSARIQEFDRIWLTIEIEGVSKDSASANYAATDTVFTNDSFFVFFQSSANLVDWTINEQDTLIKIKKGANDTIVNVANSVSRDSANWVGNYGRIRVVHRNALTNQQALTANNYRKRITAWLSTVKH